MWALRGVSASAFALALAVSSFWWSSFTTMSLLHDDAKFEQALSATMDKPAVRAKLGGWLGTVIERTSGRKSVNNAALHQLQLLLASDQPVAPLTDALTRVAVTARDQAVSQLDARLSPKRVVRMDLAPLFTAAKIKVDAKTAKMMGLTVTGKAFTTELIGAEQLDQLQRRYDLTKIASTWAGWAALALIIISVLTSRRPLRTLAFAAVAVVVVALAAPPLLSRLATWVGSNDLGPLLQPLIVSIGSAVDPYLVPVIVIAAVAAAALAVGQVLLDRRAVSRAG